MGTEGEEPRRGKRKVRGRASTPTTDARKVRSTFGTRVAKSIVCSACGAQDTIHFAPRPGQTTLCRRCAADQLGVVDRDANIRPERRERCDRCGMFVPKLCAFEDPLDCPQHARALALQQDGRARDAVQAKPGVIRSRRKPPE